jgi:hypothetical protein
MISVTIPRRAKMGTAIDLSRALRRRLQLVARMHAAHGRWPPFHDVCGNLTFDGRRNEPKAHSRAQRLVGSPQTDEVRDLLNASDEEVFDMPKAKTVARARKAGREGKAPTTAAGEFVREEIEHVRRGKHGARSPKQAIAVGLSKARRAGVKLKPPAPGRASARTRKQAERDWRKGRTGASKPSPRRSRATTSALRREGRRAASPRALAAQARQASRLGRKTNGSARGPSSRAATTSTRRQGTARSTRRAPRSRAAAI